MADVFTEVVVAPSYAEGASAVLAERRNLRVLRLPVAPPRGGAELRPVSGGLLRDATRPKLAISSLTFMNTSSCLE